jgi:hypothetical protein
MATLLTRILSTQHKIIIIKRILRRDPASGRRSDRE